MTHLLPTFTLLRIFIQPWSRELQRKQSPDRDRGSPPLWKHWHVLAKARPFFWVTAEYLATAQVQIHSSPAGWPTGFSRCTWVHSSRPAWQQRSAHPLSAGRFLWFLSPWSLLPADPALLWFLAFWTGNSHEKKQWEFHSKCRHSLYIKICPYGVQGQSLLAPWRN